MTLTTSAGNATVPRSVLGPEHPAIPEDHPFRTGFAAWLAENPPPGEAPRDEDAAYEQRLDWQRTLHAGGWAGVRWPVEFGGRGLGPLEQLMQYEELALVRAPEPANTPGMILLGPTLMRLGDDELKRRFLPGILSGDDLWCQGFSEPEAGSDLASLRTRARLVDGQWRIDGQKIWTTFADRAGWCFVLARTDPGSERHRGLSLLICAMDQPGVTVRRIRQISGDHEFAEVFLDDAVAPESYVVGEPGQGWAAAMTLFRFERGDPGYTDHARLLVELHATRPLLSPEHLSGPRLAEARARYVELWLRAQELRQLNIRLTLEELAGREVLELGSVSNLVWGELAKDVADLAADVHGADGVLAGSASHHRLASRAKSIYSGTSEIQRTIVAERLLGLPR